MVKPEERLPVSVRRKVIKEELPAFGTMCRTTEPTDDILHGFLQFDLHRLLGEGAFEIRRAGRDVLAVGMPQRQIERKLTPAGRRMQPFSSVVRW